MKKKLNITVLVDETVVPANDPDFSEPPEKPVTEYHVIGALRNLKHNVTVLAAIEDISVIVNTLSEQKCDLVFNLTEQLAGDRQHDKNIASLLEMTNLPFTGTGTTGLLLCRDKRLCKQLLKLHKIRVPEFLSFPLNQTVRIPKKVHYPLVVKPAFEDSSEGISNASIVTNEAALKERVEFVHNRWDQPVIAEEYIQGRELYVAVLGNKKLNVLAPRECFLDCAEQGGPQLATYRVKWNKEYRKKWNITFGFAELESSVKKNIERICKRVHRILQLRDYSRIDLRLTPENKIVILEVNPNPDLAYGEEVAEAAEKSGLNFEQFIQQIVNLAIRRSKQKSYDIY